MSMPIAISASDVNDILSAGPDQRELETTCQRLSIKVEGGTFRINEWVIPREELQKARSDSVLYTITDGRLEKLQLFRGHLFKLAPSGGYPALEIDGVRMHRTKDMLPDEEARVKMDSLGVGGKMRVLDICTGLGYSSQEAARRGAGVMTIEKNAPVIDLARLNPCSRDFFHYMASGSIDLVIGDAIRLLATMPGEGFDRVIHDPPSFPFARELYSLSFYRDLRRVIRENGVLLHYTGQPGSRYRRLDLKRSVSRRLREAGFSTSWVEKARSVLARPRRGKNGR